MRKTIAALLLWLLVVVQVQAEPQCKFDYTSLALLSCQETTPQTPTPSCCDALLYAIDTWPLSNTDKGACCLCWYLRARAPVFDLAGSYIACHGHDAAAMDKWRQHKTDSCDGPCGLIVAVGAPPPPGPARSTKKKKKVAGAGVIVAIVGGCVAGILLLGCSCVYCYRRRRAGKERESPDPSHNSCISRSDGIEMMSSGRLSSAARSSTSRLLSSTWPHNALIS